MSNAYDRWFIREASPKARSFRLYCIPYAGGSASVYRDWQAGFPDSVEVCAIQLPGRGSRYGEPMITSMDTLAEQLAEAIAGDATMPFALFGHSLGGLVAFEVARQLAGSRRALPAHLFISAAAAPDRRSASPVVSALPDDELIRTVAAYGGTPAAVLRDRELMELLLPAIRADFGILERFTYSSDELLTLPITVFGGRQDDGISASELRAWGQHTSGSFAEHWVEGDHFFVSACSDELIAHIRVQCQL